MVYRHIFLGATLLLNVLVTVGCGSVKYSSAASSILARTWTSDQESPPEKDYCITNLIYNQSYTISGKALYEYRPIGVEPGNEGLLAIAEEPRPIRHAQFDVTDSSGEILQCGETDGDGNFLFTVPQNNRALSINIYSRSNNIFNRASVFIAPETNTLHKVQHFFTANADQSDIEILADARETLVGGAFHILDQIHNTFDKLESHTNPGQGIDPLNIPKVDIYWEKGFNPGLYLGLDSGISFFSKPQRKLFILGGLNGDTDFADTDHFDSSVIIHEYYHFLEISVSTSNSPGGSHNGNQLLDPRLAWSEGAAQFFQAFVTGIPSVLDTRGNVDGSTGFFVKYSVENETTDIPQEDGEGEFREFAVARALWDIHDTEDGESAPEGFDNLNGFFTYFWRAVTSSGTSADFNNLKAAFNSSGLFFDVIDHIFNISGDSDWISLLNQNRMAQPDNLNADSYREEYAQILEPSGSTDSFSIVGPTFVPSTSLPNNHPVASMNSYFTIVPGGTSRSFTFTHTGSTNTEPGRQGELQMYIFNEDYRNFDDFIAGPLSSGQTINLTGGADGRVYFAVVVVSDLPLPADGFSSEDVVMNYEFSGHARGGF